MAERSLFDTRGAPTGCGFEAWRRSVGVIFDVNPAPASPVEAFNARVDSLLIDGLVLSRCHSGAQAFARPLSRFAADGLDHYMIQLFLRGGVEMARGRSSVRAPAGAIVGFDLAEVLDSVNDEFDLLSLFIPRRRLAPMLTRPDSLQGAVVDSGAGGGRLLADYLMSIHRTAPEMNETEGAVAAEVLLRLVAMAFNAADLAANDPPAWADQAVVVNARTVMGDRLHDPDLTPDAIAAGVGVSRARLYRAFGQTGGVMDTLREMRLRRCLADLLAPSEAHRQVAEIAYRWGFADPTHFARAFKARFGESPRDMRRNRRPDLSLGTGFPTLDHTYETWIASIG